jgi:hypothetical protein
VVLKKLRKSSSRVSLVLIGVAALAACSSEDQPSKRDVYASREDCLSDWGNKADDCTPATEAQHRSRGFYYGPHYFGSGGFSSWGSNSGRSSHAVGSTTSSSRGGFGSSGHASGG